jgi:hypothetical protein
MGSSEVSQEGTLFHFVITNAIMILAPLIGFNGRQAG